jgi:hypothetical protein
MNITSSPQYLHQDKKPVLVIWGIGFTDRPVDSVQDALAIINYFKNEAGVSLYQARKRKLLKTTLGLSCWRSTIFLASRIS